MPAGTQGGKKKPLKAPKKVCVVTDEDLEFKKKDAELKRKDEEARKALLAKMATKKK
ncbi:hypothetical protein MACK_003749 [Theileria orientalis]|uniref:Translation machinery associated TMA7 n=1 Tax=Theileria orientalis TaxID=68886 RepID=A0A976SIY7_THEOR|nr:hypothetical protein MACK_003749 [Theileria orientalis]